MTRLSPLRAAAIVAGAFATVAVAACDDKPEHPTAPSEPAAAVVTAPAPVAGSGVSTVCLAYMTKQSVAKEKLAEAVKAKSQATVRMLLEKKIEKLDAVIADVCH